MLSFSAILMISRDYFLACVCWGGGLASCCITCCTFPFFFFFASQSPTESEHDESEEDQGSDSRSRSSGQLSGSPSIHSAGSMGSAVSWWLYLLSFWPVWWKRENLSFWDTRAIWQFVKLNIVGPGTSNGNQRQQAATTPPCHWPSPHTPRSPWAEEAQICGPDLWPTSEMSPLHIAHGGAPEAGHNVWR